MSWKDILKKLSPRERMDAEEFAPEEMQAHRDRKTREDRAGALMVIHQHMAELDSDRPIEERRFLNIRNSIQQLLRGFESAPRLRGKSREQVVENLKEFLDRYDE
jgi:hypothetical protein